MTADVPVSETSLSNDFREDEPLTNNINVNEEAPAGPSLKRLLFLPNPS